MAIRYLKSGKPQVERSEDDAKVRAVVEAALAEIEARGDAAVRELAEKFDNYSPASYQLAQDEIDELIAQAEVTARPLLGPPWGQRPWPPPRRGGRRHRLSRGAALTRRRLVSRRRCQCAAYTAGNRDEGRGRGCGRGRGERRGEERRGGGGG